MKRLVAVIAMAGALLSGAAASAAVGPHSVDVVGASVTVRELLAPEMKVDAADLRSTR